MFDWKEFGGRLNKYVNILAPMSVDDIKSDPRKVAEALIGMGEECLRMAEEIHPEELEDMSGKIKCKDCGKEIVDRSDCVCGSCFADSQTDYPWPL